MFKIYIYYYSFILLLYELSAIIVKIKFNKDFIFFTFFIFIHILLFYKFNINKIKITFLNAFLLCMLNYILNVFASFIYIILLSIVNKQSFPSIEFDYNEWYIKILGFLLSIIYILCFCIFYNIFVKIVDYFKKNKLK